MRWSSVIVCFLVGTFARIDRATAADNCAAGDLVAVAIIAINRSNFDDAWKELERAEACDHELSILAEIHRQKGRVLYARRLWVETGLAFFRAMKIEPDWEPPTPPYTAE